jgi:PAS domain S-box-containing protein
MKDLHSRFFQIAAELLATADARGYLCELSPAWTTTLGFSFDELRSQPLLDFVHPEDRPATERATERVLHGTAPASFENRCLCKDGGYKRLRWLSRFSRQQGVILACVRLVTGAADLAALAQRSADRARSTDRK